MMVFLAQEFRRFETVFENLENCRHQAFKRAVIN